MDFKWERYKDTPPSDTIFEAKRMSNGKWVRGQLIGEQPFVYILTHENYGEAIITDTGRGHCEANMRLIRVIGHSVRQVDRFERVCVPEDKNDAEFGVGDIVRGRCEDGFEFDGRIFRVEVKKEGDKLHPIMFVSQLADSKVEPFGHAAIWIENVTELEILRFKEEKPGEPDSLYSGM